MQQIYWHILGDRRYAMLSYDVETESVIKPCIKNDNPLVD